MRRIGLAVVLALSLLLTPLAGEAQQAGKVFRLGLLTPASPPASPTATGPFLISGLLRELGYIEGENLVIERRFADGKLDRLPALAKELVQLRVDVIVAVSDQAIRAAKGATNTIPIVMGFGANPVGRGLVASLARPGGNVTGVAYSADDAGLAAKRLELIREAVPRAAGIAVLTTGEFGARAQVQESLKAASVLGVKLVVVEVRGDDYDRAFEAALAQQAGALFVVASPILNTARQRIIGLAAKHRLPAIYEWREHVEEGGLMAYGSSLAQLYRLVIAYVDRIFKGAKPSELPVEQPTTVGVAINLKTAKALGLTIPQSLLVRADQVIQ
jgi:putative ABC transport system substrate-binding protein